MYSRSRSPSVFLLATLDFGHTRSRSGRATGLRPRRRPGPRPWLVAAAAGFLWFHCGLAITAKAQVPGVVGSGGIYGGPGLPQSPGSPPPTTFGARSREVFDPNALAHIKSFCVDSRNLEGWQADEVREFLAKNSQPKKLLGRLHWQLTDDCNEADAVARIYFAPVNIEDVAREYSLSSPPRFQQGYQPVLLLYDKASIRLFYLAACPQAYPPSEGQVRYRNTVDGLRSVFSMLLKDLKRVDRHRVALGHSPASALRALPSQQENEDTYHSNAYTLIDLPLPELVADLPELRGIKPAAGQQQLPTILRRVGTSVEQLYQKLTSFAAAEQLTQEQYSYDGRLKSTRQSRLGCLFIVNHDLPSATVQEYRTDARMRRVGFTGVEEGFNSTMNSSSMWVLFYPENQSGTAFRYLGEQASNGRDLYVVGFAERPGKAAVRLRVYAQGRSAVLLCQGVAWIDPASFRIVRMRLDLLEPRLDVGLERQTTEIRFGEVRAPLGSAALWLPREVTVTTIYNERLYRNRSLYSNFRFFVVKSKIVPTHPSPPPQLPN
jgi:hypothetical protein